MIKKNKKSKKYWIAKTSKNHDIWLNEKIFRRQKINKSNFFFLTTLKTFYKRSNANKSTSWKTKKRRKKRKICQLNRSKNQINYHWNFEKMTNETIKFQKHCCFSFVITKIFLIKNNCTKNLQRIIRDFSCVMSSFRRRVCAKKKCKLMYMLTKKLWLINSFANMSNWFTIDEKL